jgi:hypothetical protein
VSMALISMMMSIMMSMMTSIMMSASTPTSISTLSAINDDNPKLQLLLPHSSLLRVPSSPLIPSSDHVVAEGSLHKGCRYRSWISMSAFHSTTRHDTSVLLLVSENWRWLTSRNLLGWS